MNSNQSNINSIDEWLNFWYYKRGINIFPLDKDKTTYEKWCHYQTNAVPDEIHETGKEKVDIKRE